MAGHCAVVLAAGGSRRLGRPKQLLRREGETLVHRVARLAMATGPQRVLVICGAHEHGIREAVADLTLERLAVECLAVECVHNAQWQGGLASSLRVTAASLAGHAGATLLLACDQPALEAHHLDELLTRAAASASGCAATRHGEKGDVRAGIPAVVSSSILQSAMDLHGDRGLRHALNTQAADTLGWLDAPELQFDLDTVDDVACAKRQGWLDPLDEGARRDAAGFGDDPA
jgi:molybdenum cofactor cytidylyltransferase